MSLYSERVNLIAKKYTIGLDFYEEQHLKELTKIIRDTENNDEDSLLKKLKKISIWLKLKNKSES